MTPFRDYFTNTSWGSTVNFAVTNPVHSGTKAIGLTITSAWGAFQAYDGGLIDTTPFTNLRFWMRASKAGENFAVGMTNANNQQIPLVPVANYGPPLAAEPGRSTWCPSARSTRAASRSPAS